MTPTRGECICIKDDALTKYVTHTTTAKIISMKVYAKSEYGRLQPQALDLEEAVIGACLIEQDAFGQVSDYLKPESFYDSKNQHVFRAIQR